MPKINQYLTYILEKLQPHGPIRARAMFGGDIMFASVVNNQLFFRVDDHNKKDYAFFDSKPFIYYGMAKPIVLPYLSLPEEILENPKELPMWIEKSCQATIRNKKPRKTKTSQKR